MCLFKGYIYCVNPGMKNTLLFSLFFCCGLMGFAQNPLVKQWDKRFGGNHPDVLTSLQQTLDGGYILGGYSNSIDTGDKTQSYIGGYDYWVVKLDSIGNKQWDKTFGGNKDDKLTCLQQTNDRGYILGGYSFSGVSGNKAQPNWDTTSRTSDYWIVKIDSVGNQEWDKRYGGIDSDFFYFLQQTRDGGYLIGGYTYSDIGGDITTISLQEEDFWVIKTDDLGNQLWDKRYGWSEDDFFSALQQTNDGGYILGGYSETFGLFIGSSPVDYYIVKTDAVGNTQWIKRFGGPGDDKLYSLQQTKDGGYILGGVTYSDSCSDVSQITRGYSDYWMVKIDSNGSKEWDKRFGGTYKEDAFGYIKQTKDGGYLLSGTSSSSIGGDKTESGLTSSQAWVVKTDSVGNKVWDKTIPMASIDVNSRAIQNKEGCYLFANSTTAGIGHYKTQTARGGYDYWLIKFCDTTSHCNLSSPTVQANQTIFCSGDSVQVCATASSVSYLWSTGETTNCIYANQAGNYYVTVTDANSCSAVSNHLPVYVYPLPPVSVTVTGNTLTSFNGATYQWYLNDTAINGANSSVYVANQTGNYAVEISDSNGCHTFSNPVNVTVSGIASLSNQHSAISISPNPTTSQLFIQTTGAVITGVNIYNTLGALVMAAQPATVNCKLSTVNLATGVYFVEINIAGERIIKKVVKE